MNISIINDCRDDNAAARQKIRVQQLFGQSPTFIGVSNELEAAGNLIDALDAVGNDKGLILVNVAPRHGNAKKWENGTPFGYFHYKNTLVVSTVDGAVLSLAKKLEITPKIKILDIREGTRKLIEKGFAAKNLEENIVKSQFRSFDFLPRIAAYLIFIKSDLGKISPISAETPPAVWFVDNFGNCKTTILENEIPANTDNIRFARIGKLKFYPRLKDVPHGKPGLIIGSSGIENKRFLEIVIQGKNAAKRFKLKTGSILKITKPVANIV